MTTRIQTFTAVYDELTRAARTIPLGLHMPAFDRYMAADDWESAYKELLMVRRSLPVGTEFSDALDRTSVLLYGHGRPWMQKVADTLWEIYSVEMQVGVRHWYDHLAAVVLFPVNLMIFIVLS